MVVLFELTAHFVIRSRVPPDSDWEAASAYIRSEKQPGDLILVAPDWADPLLRLHLGDEIPIAAAGRADFAPFERVWEVSIRGHWHRGLNPRDAEPLPLHEFGEVSVRLHDIGPSPIVANLIDALPQAEVRIGERACRWQSRRAEGGGLGRGALWPKDRFHCGPQPWLFVGETVLEDLDLQPRRCVWQHPASGEPVRTTLRNVPLGERIVLHAGLYYVHERPLTGGTVEVEVELDGESIGTMVHRDGDGWKRLEVSTETRARGDRARGDVTIEVRADQPDMRTLCWAASTRGPAASSESIP